MKDAEKAFEEFLDESIDCEDPYWAKIEKVEEGWRDLKDKTFKAGFLEGFRFGLKNCNQLQEVKEVQKIKLKMGAK